MTGSTAPTQRSRLVAERPIPTFVFETPQQFSPASGSAYVFARTDEERSQHVDEWINMADVRTAFIVDQRPDDFVAEIEGNRYDVSPTAGGD